MDIGSSVERWAYGKELAAVIGWAAGAESQESKPGREPGMSRELPRPVMSSELLDVIDDVRTRLRALLIDWPGGGRQKEPDWLRLAEREKRASEESADKRLAVGVAGVCGGTLVLVSVAMSVSKSAISASKEDGWMSIAASIAASIPPV